MKRIQYVFSSLVLLLLPVVAGAQRVNNFDASGGEFGLFLGNVLEFTNQILIPFILGIGFLFFVYGMFRYFIAGGGNEDDRDKGKQIIIYSILGFVLIIIFWGIINILVDGVGFGGETLEVLPGGVQLDNI